MPEPKVIAVFKFSRFGPQVGAFYKINADITIEGGGPLLYNNGECLNGHKLVAKSILDSKTKHNNEGPVHPDDWYWNENESRFIKMTTLSEDEYLNVMMSDAFRINISEWDGNYIECATEAEARYRINKINFPRNSGSNPHKR